MKTLVIVVHPQLEKSAFNKRWVEELSKYPERYDIHLLHEAYPDGKLDVAAEQKRIECYEKIVFQFPYYWFNCPPFFKQWLDEVLTYGWAYGRASGYKISGKKVALALSIGIDENQYCADGAYKYTIEELTRPFELTFAYVRADYRPFFAHYGIELNSTEDAIEESVAPYMEFLDKL
ncbi:NAD(P)H-dependent oxidoreductase [Sphingobacterium suaedae]|uniref:NAD(P)H-dependent oxidoreductase n=1 Tax=Sphingobacterium suaedae TaxID=1686402 RepID=A0ABW5KH40_9SPHI